jgi:hypothetical protein
MSPAADGGRRYAVHCSGAIAEGLKQLQRDAPGPRERKAIASAFGQIVRRLQHTPLTAGEACYRLPGLRMRVRTCAVAPLVVDFAVCEDRPLVFIKGAKLLPEPQT